MPCSILANFNNPLNFRKTFWTEISIFPQDRGLKDIFKNFKIV